MSVAVVNTVVYCLDSISSTSFEDKILLPNLKSAQKIQKAKWILCIIPANPALSSGRKKKKKSQNFLSQLVIQI